MERWEGGTGAAYFENPNDPTQHDRMRQRFFDSWEHAENAWEPIVGYIRQAMEGTPFPHVGLYHTGGGCWNLFCYPDDTCDDDGPYLISGPHEVDPMPEASYLDESASYCTNYEDSEGPIVGICDGPLDPHDWLGYAQALSAAFLKLVAERTT